MAEEKMLADSGRSRREEENRYANRYAERQGIFE